MKQQNKQLTHLKWPCMILLNLLACSLYAQTKPENSIISTKRVLLQYKNQRDTLWIPVVPDKYPALKKALAYQKLFDGDNLNAVIKNYDTCGCGVTGLRYAVTFEGKGIISIKIYVDYYGAYPNSYEKWYTLETATGKVYPVTRELNSAGLNWVLQNYKAILRKRIATEKQENDTEDTATWNTLKADIADLKRAELLGKYVFTKEGIQFSTEAALGHAVHLFEPYRDWLIPYDRLTKFKAPGAAILK